MCTCDKETEKIECNYGTFENCKFRVGKQFYCILNPQGQLRRKRDLRYLESLMSDTTPSYEHEREFLVRTRILCKKSVLL